MACSSVLSVLFTGLIALCFNLDTVIAIGTGAIPWYKFNSMTLVEMYRVEAEVEEARDEMMAELMSFSGGGLDAAISPQCLIDTAKFPIKALDAFGKPRSGILGENSYWLGNFHECTSLGTYQHCVADMVIDTSINNSTTPLFKIYWGICMPESCSEDDIEKLINATTNFVSKEFNVSVFHLNPNPPKPKDDKPGGVIHCNQIPAKPKKGGFTSIVFLCSLLGCFMLLGSAIDVYLRWFEAQKVTDYQTVGVTPAKNHTESTPFLKPQNDDSQHIKFQRLEANQTHEDQGFIVKFLLCFAVNISLDKFLNAKQGDKSIPCLNGIRVLSISWIILAHSMLFPFSHLMYDDLTEAFGLAKRLDFTVVLQAEYAVDTFFLLSGCLVAYLSLMKMEQTSGKLPWGFFYIHRFLRLTPVYGSMIIFLLFIDPYIGNGPLWYRYVNHQNCEKYWWRNLLYISNFFPYGEMCMNWSWYLPLDMQFFIITPIFLVLLHKVPKLGFGILSLLTLVSLMVKTILSATYAPKQTNPLYNQGGGGEYWDMIYTKPWTRVPPYFVGIALGFILMRRPNLRMKPIVALCGWLSAVSVALVVIYIYNDQFYREWSTAGKSIYGGVASFIWALCVAWVILACKTGYGGWINTFLSWNFWVPVGRLTYTVYLVHPIIIRNILFSNSNPYNTSMISLSTMFTSGIVLSHMVALLFTLGVEFPFANLEKLVFPTSLQKK